MMDPLRPQDLRAVSSQEATGSGARSVRTVPVALLDEHLYVDAAKNSVEWYRRLLGHIGWEMSFVLERDPSERRAEYLKRWEQCKPAAEKLYTEFKRRPKVSVSPPQIRPLNGDPENVMYVIIMGVGGPQSIVMGRDLPSGTKSLLEPYRDQKFENGVDPLIDFHTRLHVLMIRLGLIVFKSAFSNAAPTSTDETWNAEIDQTEAVILEVAKDNGGELPKIPAAYVTRPEDDGEWGPDEDS